MKRFLLLLPLAACTQTPTQAPAAAQTQTQPSSSSFHCDQSRHGDFLKLVGEQSADVFTAEVTEQRVSPNDDRAPTVLVCRVDRVLTGTHVHKGDVIQAQGEGNGMKALSPLDARVTGAGAKLLFACDDSSASVEVSDADGESAADSCVSLVKNAGTRDEIAARLAAGLVSTSQRADLVRACARRAVCHATDQVAVIQAITRVAATYSGDPLTVWTLMDGLRVHSVNASFAHDLGCGSRAQLTDPSQGASDANVAAVVAQLTLASKDGHVTWLRDAQELMAATNAGKAIVAKIPSALRTAALAKIAKLSAADHAQVSALEGLLASAP